MPWLGSWVLTNVTRYYDSSEQVYEGDFDPYHDSTGQVINWVYTFNSDGTGSVDVYGTTDFIYTATADEISFTFTDSDQVQPYELSGNTLIFTFQMTNAEAQIEGSLVMTFTKQ